MGFSWLDILLFFIVIATIVWQIRRDLGQSLFDTLALALGLRLALWVAPALAPHLSDGNPQHARGIALLVSFVVFSGVGLVIGSYLHRLTLWTLDTFDRVAGLLLGFSSAVILCHVLVSSVALIDATRQGPPKYVKQSWLAREALSFHTCRQVVRFFNGLRV